MSIENVPVSVQFRLRFYRDGRIAIGPGKIALLEAIEQAGSISAGARLLDMSYRRAWLLIDEMNQSMRGPVLSTSNNGAALTAIGRQVVQGYRRIEKLAQQAAAEEIDALLGLLEKE